MNVTLPRATLVRRGVAGEFDARTEPPAPGFLGRVLATALAPVTSVHRTARPDVPVVALTWDDGPHPVHTPRVLDALASAGARATFFVLAEQAEHHSGIVRRALDEGHEVGLHGIDHQRLSGLTGRRAARLVREGRRRLEDVTGCPVTLFRPPYGAQTLSQVVRVNASGLRTVLWSAWVRDWEEVDAAEVSRRAADVIGPGDVVLLHDSYGEAASGMTPWSGPAFDRAAVAASVAADLSSRGLRAVTVTELLTLGVQTTVWFERRPRTSVSDGSRAAQSGAYDSQS